jgi:hypothetical protein
MAAIPDLRCAGKKHLGFRRERGEKGFARGDLCLPAFEAALRKTFESRRAQTESDGWYARESTMEQNLQDTMALLARTPATLDALLRDLPEAWTLRNEGAGTWSAFDVVGHLIHGERTDWIPRARVILEFGETRDFEPFDRWGQERESAGKSLVQLLDEFARLRMEGLAALRAMNLSPKDLERRGRHPALGAVTLSQLLATWAAHDLTHLHQISRVMAHQYDAAVGPWYAYLGVLNCGGHSAP